MRDCIKFIIHGDPIAWARAQKSGKIHFTPKRQREYMDVVRAYAMEAMRGRAPIDGGVYAFMRFQYEFPKSVPIKDRTVGRMKTTRPDFDNLAKIIADSCNGIVYTDDARIGSITIQKIYHETAQTLVCMWSDGP